MLSVVSLLALSACSNDDSDTLARVPLTIKATIQGAETRVAYNDDGSGSFTEGDVIKVYSFDSNVSGYDSGVEYTFDGKNWVTDNPLYFDPSDTKSYEVNAMYNNFDDSGIYDNTNHIIDQSNRLLGDILNASAQCSARNSEATFSFKHYRSKITLNFSSAVTECKLIIGDWTTKCHLIEEGKTAEALMDQKSSISGIEVQVTVDKKIYTGTINLTELKSNTHYIYNIKISDVLTVDSGTSIAGFEDSGTTFEAEQ
jgi:hypothetical protein